MYAAYIEDHGSPEDIRYGTLPEPTTGPTDVLVDVHAVAVNNVDTFVRSGAWRTPVDFPFVIGRDLVGTVAAAGSAVREFAPGDRVWCNSLGHDGRQGAASERALVPVDRLYPLPARCDPLEMVALAHPATTAHLGLFRHGELAAGQCVVVVGAAGNVGGAAVTLAARAGARVIALASPRDHEHCAALGASAVVDYHATDLAGEVNRLAPDGVDLWLDTAGVNALAVAVDALAWRGRVVVLAGMGATPSLPVGRLYLKDASVRGFAISRATVEELRAAAGEVARLNAEGALRPRSVRRMPLSAAGEAHRWVESGKQRGKVVLLPEGSPLGKET